MELGVSCSVYKACLLYDYHEFVMEWLQKYGHLINIYLQAANFKILDNLSG